MHTINVSVFDEMILNVHVNIVYIIIVLGSNERTGCHMVLFVHNFRFGAERGGS